MNSKRVRRRFQQALPTLWAAFACADVIAEATRRELCRGGHPDAADPRLPGSTRELFVLLGRGLLRKLRQLLAVDGRYQELRARQRRYQARRDRIAKRLYRELVDARLFFKGLFGYQGACEYLGLKGETAREPWDLYHQVSEAVHRARTHEALESEYFGKQDAKARQVVDQLEDLCNDLDSAIDDVLRGGREVEGAMLEQREVMKDFDRTFKESAKILEAQLIGAGLPTLGDAVRPGVGRRGRPLKKRPLDLYPDLVARVRAEGMMAVDFAPVQRDPVKRVDDKATGDVANESNGEDVAEPSKNVNDGASVLSRLRLPPPVAACSRGQQLYHPSARRRGERRTAVGGSRIGRIRKAASTWWERLKQTA